MSDPRETLINALLTGTADGTIKWEQANTNASAFIAKRKHGTVTIEGPPGGLGSALGAAFGQTPRLIVKDSTGKTVEEIAGSGPSTTLIAAFRPHPAAMLPQLYSLVHEQVTRAEATMRNLTKDFEQPA